MTTTQPEFTVSFVKESGNVSNAYSLHRTDNGNTVALFVGSNKEQNANFHAMAKETARDLDALKAELHQRNNTRDQELVEISDATERAEKAETKCGELLAALKDAAEDAHAYRLDTENGLEPDPERMNVITNKLDAAIARAEAK